MVEDSFSCIKEVTKTVRLTLPLAWVSNEINGVCDTLESWKRQYIQQLKAVVVGYKNVSLISALGFSKYESPFIRCDVNATFELFYLTVGSIVKGKINRISHDYIGCLVHNTINVTIDQPSDISDVSNFIALDRCILFEITRLDSKRKIISVRGKITPECIKLMIESDLFKTEFVTIDNTSTHLSPNSDAGIKSKRRKLSSPQKKHSSITSVQCSSLQLEKSADMTSHISSPIEKKKHKKSKSVLSSPPLFSESLESEENEIEPTQLQEITTAKKNKKSKTKARTDENMKNFGSVGPIHVKNEVHTDSSSSHASPKKLLQENMEASCISSSKKSSLKKKSKKSKSQTSSEEFLKNFEDVDFPSNIEIKNNTGSQIHSMKSINLNNDSENFTDVYEMMEALSSFEPPPEAQLLSNEFSKSTVKEEPLDIAKISKKRKRESSDLNSLPKKKRKLKDENDLNKVHDKGKKSKKNSKKDKKKKSNRVISTKKKILGHEVKLKKKNKPEKSKTKNKKKSVKHKVKNVPLHVTIKSEKN